MTEKEWLACRDPAKIFDWLDQSRRAPDRSPRLVRQFRQQVLDALKARARPRVLRLFGCACCRRLWHLLPPGQKAAVETAEGYADHPDGEVRLSLDDQAVSLREAIRASLTQSQPAWDVQTWEGASNRLTLAVLCQLEGTYRFRPQDGAWALAEAATWAVVRDAPSVTVANLEALRESAMQAEQAWQCELLWDVLGNPFCPVTFSPAWRTDTTVTLAQQMYESRDFGAMPILADALQDAGCDNDDILNHCRGGGPHVRGCWVVDLVLGKE